jgi:hypothetical protein
MADLLVIETTVLIDNHREDSLASAYVDALLAKEVAVVHPVSAAEMLEGVRNQQNLIETLRFLGSFKRLLVKSADYEQCLLLMSEYRLSHGIGWPDCLIAATCIRLGLPLVTLNDKHFRVIRGLRVVRPY